MDMNLAPGFRFNPFENELINLYLKPKVLGEIVSSKVIGERQLYGPNANPWQVFDPQNYPWILSEVSCGKFEKVAYAFVNLTKKAANSDNKRKNVGREQYIKKTGCGTWDGQTKRTKITDFEGNLIGERRMLVFKINEVSDHQDLTRVGHWRMHEYHLCGVNRDIPNLSNTVLCKIILDHSKKPAIKLHSNLEHVENVPVSLDDDVADFDLDDWVNSIFSSDEGEGGDLYLNLPNQSYPEPTNLGKRKFHDETSYAVSKKLCC